MLVGRLGVIFDCKAGEGRFLYSHGLTCWREVSVGEDDRFAAVAPHRFGDTTEHLLQCF